MRPVATREEYRAYLDSLDRACLHPLVREGFRHWRGLLNGRRFPGRAEVDPIAVPRSLPQISIVDVDPGATGFRLRLLGHHNRLFQGVRSGEDIQDVRPEQGRDRIVARLRLCAAEARPIRGVYRYKPVQAQAAVWAEVVSCPLSDDQQSVTHIVSFGADFEEPPPGDLAAWP